MECFVHGKLDSLAPPNLPRSLVRFAMRVLLTAAELAAGIERLAAEVERESRGTPLMVVGVLTGSIVIVADLIRRIEGPVSVSMAWASSYRGTATEPGSLELHLDLLPDLAGQDVLVVDDIFDTGRTMEAIVGPLRPLDHVAALDAADIAAARAAQFPSRGHDPLLREP